MSIVHWPLAERPREKLRARGSAALSDAELLAILLGTGTRGRTAVDVAREALTSAGGLTALLRLDEDGLQSLPGLGPSRYAIFQAALEIARRVLFADLEARDAMTSPGSAERYLQARLAGREREVFTCLFLDSQHRVIACEDLFTGTLDGAAVYPREIARRVLLINAGAVILAHNHPSGLAEPSAADRRITSRISESLALLEVRVLDHFVIGQGQCVSFARRGWL